MGGGLLLVVSLLCGGYTGSKMLGAVDFVYRARAREI